MKIRFSKPTFRTFHEGRVTSCSFNCTLLINGSEVKRFKTHATTQLAEGDTPDPVKARHLAESKAKLKAYEVAVAGSNANAVSEVLHRTLERVAECKSILKLIHLRNAERKHIHQLKK